MARSRRGIHAPNNWGQRTDLDKFLALADTISHVTMLDGEADLVPVLQQHGVDGTLLVRFYHGAWWGDFSRSTPLIDPVDWAERVVYEYNRDRGGWSLASTGAHVVWDNELNLSEEGGGPGNDLDTGRGIIWYQRINAWKLKVRQVVGNRIPADRIHWGAMAYGHSCDDNTRGYTGMEICRESINAYAVLDVHPYWFEPAQVADPYHGHRFVLSHALFPAKPIFLSEAGNFAVTRDTAPEEMATWFASLDAFPYIVGATPFIFRDPTGAHSVNNWGANLAIEQRVIAMGSSPVPVPTPTPVPTPGGNMTTAEILRLAADIYTRAGVAWNPDGAIAKYWLASWDAGRFLGAPSSPEHKSESRRYTIQEFASAVLFWDSQTGKVQSTIPL